MNTTHIMVMTKKTMKFMMNYSHDMDPNSFHCMSEGSGDSSIVQPAKYLFLDLLLQVHHQQL